MRSEFYKKCCIAVTASKHVPGWTFVVQVMWKQAGVYREESFVGDCTFGSEVDAEEHGLKLGEKWVSEQLFRALIDPS